MFRKLQDNLRPESDKTRINPQKQLGSFNHPLQPPSENKLGGCTFSEPSSLGGLKKNLLVTSSAEFSQLRCP